MYTQPSSALLIYTAVSGSRNKSFKVVVVIGCVIGFLVQLKTLITKYLSYEVNTETKVSFDIGIQLDWSISIRFHSMISILYQISSEKSNSLRYWYWLVNSIYSIFVGRFSNENWSEYIVVQLAFEERPFPVVTICHMNPWKKGEAFRMSQYMQDLVSGVMGWCVFRNVVCYKYNCRWLRTRRRRLPRILAFPPCETALDNR